MNEEKKEENPPVQKGLFQNAQGMPEQEKKHGKVDPQISKLGEEINSVSRSIRMLEERYSTLRKKIQMSDQNIIDDSNKIFTQTKLIVKDIDGLKLNIEEMRQKLELFSNEINLMASKQDLKILQKYVDMWEPMQFLTEKHARQLIKDHINSLKK